MTIDSHVKCLRRSHKQMKGNAKVVGMRKMKDKEFDKEMIETKAQLNVFMRILQQEAEDQRCRWVL